MHNFFFQAFVYLVAAVVVPIAKRLDSVQCWAIWLQGSLGPLC